MASTEFPSVTLNNEKTSVTAVLQKKFQENKGKTTALSSTSMAFILSACGSSDDPTTSTLLSLTKSGDNYSASSVTGFALNEQTVATFDVANASSNAYSIKLDATGTGTLHFDFADAGDEVTLQAGSKVAGFTTLKVTDGSIDATNADLSSITRVEVASGIKITLAQIKTIPTIVSNSATGKIEVEVASEAEATELVSLMTAGTVSVFAATNPIDLVAAPAAPATLTAEVLTAKETETTTTVKAVAEAPADTTATTPTTPTDDTTTTTPTDDTTTTTPTTPTVDTTADVAPTIGGGSATLPVTHLGSNLYSVGGDNGNVAITKVGDNAVFTPDVGGGTSIARGSITTISSDGITVTSTAEAIDGKTTAGTSAFTVTGSDGAQTVTITSTGTGTIAMGAGADTVNVTAASGAHTVTVTSEASTTNTVNFTNAGTTNAIAMSGTAATTLDTSGTTQAYALTGATDSLVVQNVNASINGSAYTGTVTYEVTNTAASTIQTGTAATTIKGKGADAAVALTIDADANGGTPGALTIADGGAVAGDIIVGNINGAVTIANDFTGTGDITLSTGDASMTLALGTSTTGTRTIDASTAAADKTVTITGSDVLSLTSATTDLNMEAYAGAVTGQITNTDNMNILTGTGATGLMLKGNTANKTVTIDADAGTGTGGAISLANGGSVQGLVAITGLEGGLSIADDYAGTGSVSIALASNAQTLALGTSTTGTRAVDGDLLSDAEAVTMTGSDAVSVSLVAGDVTAGAYLGAMAVTATTGTNVITTGDGDDVIIGGAGADTIDGDAGTDTVSYADVTGATAHSLTNVAGVAVNLSASAITASTIATAAGGTIVIGGGAGAAGADLAAGTAGYLASTAGNSTATMVRDTIANVEGVIGSFGTDYIALGAGGMTADGGAEVDDIIGGAGNDTITGGAGADVLVGGDGDDTYVYVATTDLFDSNALVDTITEGGSAGTDSIKINNNGGATFTIAAADDLGGSKNIEKIIAAASDNIISITAHADMHNDGLQTIDLSGDTDATAANIINVAAENENLAFALTGSAGIDTITGGSGADTIIGGAGNDIFVYATSAAFIGATSGADAVIDSITGGDGTADVIQIAGAIGIGAAGTDTLARVVSTEKLTAAANADGSNNYAHAITIASDAAMGSVRTIDLSADVDADATTAITLTGVTVATTIKSAAAGSSTIVATSAADTITGGAKADAITGGGGADIIDVASDSATDNVVYAAAGDFGDTISNFVIGTGSGKDDISLATALGDSSGALTFRTAVAFDTDQATTLTALTADAGTDGNYIVELTGSTIDATLLEAIDAALAAGSSATGKTFVLIDNGTNSALLYDADSSDASVDLALVCTLAGVADITGGTDVVIL